MKTIQTYSRERMALLCLVLASSVLLLLAYLPNPREAITSLETRYSEISMRGLKIIPASCASGNTYFHSNLEPTINGHGYKTYPGDHDAGAWSPYAANYVCILWNNSGN